jgi:C4-dicarboxylate-specific signal transduction histidine kinase
MASGLAHDLSQPLAAASNFLNAALRLLDRGGDAARPPPAMPSPRAPAQPATPARAIVHRLREFMERGAASLRGQKPIAEVDGGRGRRPGPRAIRN